MKAEQFIKDCTSGCSNELCAVEDIHGKKVISYHEWLTPDQALRAVEIAREEAIEKVCEWLTQNFLNYMKYHHDGEKVYYTYNNEKLIDDLKKAMEGE